MWHLRHSVTMERLFYFFRHNPLKSLDSEKVNASKRKLFTNVYYHLFALLAFVWPLAEPAAARRSASIETAHAKGLDKIARKEDGMGAAKQPNRRQVLVGGAALTLTPNIVRAQAARPLKIGVLNDMSSVYADYQGVGSVVAAQLAVNDFSEDTGRAGRNHLRRPSEQARRRGGDRAPMVRFRACRCHHGPAEFRGGAGRDRGRSGEKQGGIGSGAGSSVMTGPKCSRNFVHWTYDTYALGTGLGKALTEAGGKSWFFISADYAFGKDLEANCAAAVRPRAAKS